MRDLVNWFGFKAHADNIPLHLPGVYLIVNLSTDKKYVGMGKDVFFRLMSHSQGSSGARRAERAIKKSGRGNFLIIPLYYMFNYKRKILLDIEGTLITLYDSVKNGYNIIEKSQDCGYGPEFKVSLLKGWNKPGVREKFRQIVNTPEIRKQRSILAREVLNRPEVLEKLSLIGKARYSNPENRIQTSKQVSKSLSSPEAKHIHSLASTRNRARPEVKAKYTALRGKRITITDGVHEKAHFRDCKIPQGWYRGRSDIFKSYWKQSQKEPTGSSITITSTES